MSLKDAIANFVISHSTLLQKIESMAVNELVAVIKERYPNDVLVITIVQKMADELFKLQGIDSTAK